MYSIKLIFKKWIQPENWIILSLESAIFPLILQSGLKIISKKKSLKIEKLLIRHDPICDRFRNSYLDPRETKNPHQFLTAIITQKYQTSKVSFLNLLKFSWMKKILGPKLLKLNFVKNPKGHFRSFEGT